MTIPAMADHLGVTEGEVRDRIRSLTVAEETLITETLKGDPEMLSLLEKNILTYESRTHRNKAEYLRGVHEHFTDNDVMYKTLLRSIIARQEAYDYAPVTVERLRDELG